MTHTSDVDGEGDALRWIRRRWWIAVLIPIVAVAVSLLLTQFAPYQSQVRATVLMPGDTEDPGNSERPELMVLDDLPSLVRSYVFAERVSQALGDAEISASIEEVQDSLDGTRYSRVLTVVVEGDDPDEVYAIAQAVESVLAEEINAYLVPQDGVPASVNIIDPATEPERDTSDLWFNLFLVGAAGAIVGGLVAIAIGAYEDSRDLAPDQLSADDSPA